MFTAFTLMRATTTATAGPVALNRLAINSAFLRRQQQPLAALLFPRRTYTTNGRGGGNGNNGYMSYTSDRDGDSGYQRSNSGGYGGGEGGFDLQRLSYKGAPVRPKALSLMSEEQRQMLTVDVAPAQWRKENNQYTVRRNGYILISFFDLSEEMRIDGASKKTFVVTAKNVDSILDLAPRLPYEKEDSNEDMLFYKPMNSPVMNILKITKREDRSYTFNYCEMSDEKDSVDDLESYNEINLRPGQVKMVQTICEFALPTLSGMHAIYNPGLIG